MAIIFLGDRSQQIPVQHIQEQDAEIEHLNNA